MQLLNLFLSLQVINQCPCSSWFLSEEKKKSFAQVQLIHVYLPTEKQDMSILHVLDKPNELLTAVWALTPPSTTRQQPFIDNKEGRGSRFARFLSERQTDFGSLKIGDNVIEKPSDLFRRSKM